ncbi:endolytic transglycosylase MltG [Candidatus Margulisiibacteriota bacterium]
MIARKIRGEGLLKNPSILYLYKRNKRIRKILRGSLRKISGFFEYVREQRKTNEKVDLLVYVIQFLGIILVILSLSAACVFFQVNNRFDKRIYIIDIPKGHGASRVGDLLVERDVIDGKYGYNLIINMFGLQNKMQAGTYEFTADMSLLKIILRIKNGEVVPPLLAKVVFPEGMSIYKMGKLLETEGLSDGKKFRGFTEDAVTPHLLVKYSFLAGVPNDSLEGYLFPDTYLIQSDVSAGVLADLMLARFNRVVMPYWRKNRRRTKYSLHEVLTLASIIEKEAAVSKERAIISSVYHNRLDVRMRLGADPTIKYALNRPGKIVSYDDLEVDSPYNTYKRFGLPPGPICNPGLESVKAAIYPAKTDYIYFVARADGSHVFSTNWRDHEKAKAATRQERIRKIYRRN